MTQAVTELVVRGDGALAVLDRFEKGMERAGHATEQSTGAIVDFEKRMAAARAAIERGNAVTTESVARKTAEQRAWEKWSGTVDKTQALRIRLEREAVQASVAAANAVNLGYATQEQALTTLIALEQRHAAQLQNVSDQHQRATQSVSAHAAANDNLARSMTKVSADAGGGSFQTANIAAQFQDIGVTAAMGMSPMMIALQQGTQLSSVLNSMQNPLRGLAAAFVSVLNPVSLLTIAFVALAAAAVQWIMSATKGSQDAARSLDAHRKSLDLLLPGYDHIRDAANEAADAITRLPQGVIASDLVVSLKAQEDALKRMSTTAESLGKRMTAIRQGLSAEDAFRTSNGQDAANTSAISQIRTLESISLSAQSTKEELDAAAVAARNLYNTTTDVNIKAWADEFYQLTGQLRETQAIISSTSTAMATLNMTDLSGMDEWSTIANDTRLGLSLVERAAVAAAWAIANSGDAAVVAAGQYGTATGAANAYANAMYRLGSLIPEVAAAQAQFAQMREAESNYSAALRENQALLDARGISLDEFSRRQEAATALYQRAQNQVSGLTDATKSLADAEREAAINSMAPREAALERIRDRYAAIETELKKAGAGPDELARSAAAMNLEIATSSAHFDEIATKAEGAGKKLEKLATDYRKIVSSANEFIASQQMEAAALGMTEEAANRLRYEQDLLNKAANDNIALSPAQRQELSSLAAAMAQVEERTRSLTEWYDFGRQTFGSFMSDFRRDLMNGTSLWESFGNAAGKALDSIADRALSMAANGLFDLIFGSIMGGLTGGGATGGLWKGGLWGSAIFNAKGNVFDSPSLSAYSNKVYDTPQMFAFAKGAGVFAEAGPEAIMPLGRDSQGRLGVRSAPANQNFAAGGDTYGDLTIQNSMQIMPGASEEDGAAFARGFTREMNRQGPDFFKKWQKNDLRRAG